jgi:hypothetical protein
MSNTAEKSLAKTVGEKILALVEEHNTGNLLVFWTVAEQIGPNNANITVGAEGFGCDDLAIKSVEQMVLFVEASIKNNSRYDGSETCH